MPLLRLKYVPFVSRLLLAFLSLSFFIATIISPSPPNDEENKSIVLFILLPMILSFSSTAAWLCFKSINNDEDDVKHYTAAEKGIIFLIVNPTISLIILLLIRLFQRDLFRTVPSSLNFGPKDGIANFDSNIAFTNEFNSYGHCIQGFLSGLCCTVRFVVVAVASQRQQQHNETNNAIKYTTTTTKILQILLELAAYCFTIYPIYNFSKRAILYGDMFATSSYMNNGTEWALGSVTGISIGMFINSWIIRRGGKKRKDDEENREYSADGYDDESESGIEKYNEKIDVKKCTTIATTIFELLGRTIGICFWLSICGACGMTGYAWNKCNDDRTDCINYKEQLNIGTLVGLLMIPTFMSALTVIFL